MNQSHIDPAGLTLPDTQPLDITWIIAVTMESSQ